MDKNELDKSRAEFEAWADERGLFPHARAARWEGWQAALARAGSAAPTEPTGRIDDEWLDLHLPERLRISHEVYASIKRLVSMIEKEFAAPTGQQAEPVAIRQVLSGYGGFGGWTDATEAQYDAMPKNARRILYTAPVSAAPAAPTDWLPLIKRAYRVISCAAIAQIRDGEATWEALGKAIADAEAFAAPTAAVEPSELHEFVEAVEGACLGHPETCNCDQHNPIGK